MMTMFAVVGVGSVALALVSFVGGAVFSYLFFRANPNKKAKLDNEVKRVKSQYDV